MCMTFPDTQLALAEALVGLDITEINLNTIAENLKMGDDEERAEQLEVMCKDIKKKHAELLKEYDLFRETGTEPGEAKADDDVWSADRDYSDYCKAENQAFRPLVAQIYE